MKTLNVILILIIAVLLLGGCGRRGCGWHFGHRCQGGPGFGVCAVSVTTPTDHTLALNFGAAIR